MAPARTLLSLCAIALAHSRPLYLDPSAPVDARVSALLSQMTLDEKVSQLVLPFGAKYPQDYAGYNSTGLGATYPLPGGWDVRNAWQRWQVNNTRLGIPTSFIAETLHSGYTDGTIFPMPSLQGCAWNQELVEQVSAVIAEEASVCGVDRGFSPVLHACYDPRFGRCEEAFSEDPALIALLGVAALRGLSGPGSAGAASTYLQRPDVHIATEAKHYAAYGFGGRDGAMPADVSEYTLYDVFLRPWKEYAQAGGRAIMAAHNPVNGLPSHGNRELLTEALRKRFGFGDGLCASDAGDVSKIQDFRLVQPKGSCDSTCAAGAWALNAGIDQDLEHPGAFAKLPEALSEGLVNVSTIDRAVGNVLRQKVASGLLDGREDLLFVDPARVAAVLDSSAHRALARRAAEEGIVLLRNQNSTVASAGRMLPLTGLGSAIRSVAVIGPNADNALSTGGGYTNTGAPVVTVLQGAVAAANASGNKFVVRYERGACLGGTPECACPAFAPNTPACGIDNTSRIQVAASLAAESDLTLMVLGDSTTVLAGDSTAHEETSTCGEHFDRDSLDPVGAQLPLLKAVLEATPRVVLTLIHGRPVTFGAGASDGHNSLFEQLPAVLSGWRPGEEAGHALWGILNGSVNPSGRSAHTWPRSVGQVRQYTPWFHYLGNRPDSDAYADAALATPLVAFGEGLSYSEFSLKDPKLSSTTIKPGAGFNITLSVSSTGPAGLVVVQVYFSARVSSRVRFDKALLGFAKAAVPGDSGGTEVVVGLTTGGLELWSKERKQYVVEEGVYDLHVGLSSRDPNMQHLELSVQS